MHLNSITAVRLVFMLSLSNSLCSTFMYKVRNICTVAVKILGTLRSKTVPNPLHRQVWAEGTVLLRPSVHWDFKLLVCLMSLVRDWKIWTALKLLLSERLWWLQILTSATLTPSACIIRGLPLRDTESVWGKLKSKVTTVDKRRLNRSQEMNKHFTIKMVKHHWNESMNTFKWLIKVSSSSRE